MDIVLEHVTKKIKGDTVIRDVTIHWISGTVYGLKGYNGAGKTMLMRLISGLIVPTEGSVRISGQKLGKRISFPPSMGLLLEKPGFLGGFSGIENLRLISRAGGEQCKQEILSALERVGLAEYGKKKYRKYSLGMKQRLGLAAAMLEKPDLILLDEPTNALDADGVKLVQQIIEEERERGALIVVSCHDESVLRTMSDVVCEMKNGMIIDVQKGERGEDAS